MLLTFVLPSQAIYNIKTHKEGAPAEVLNKHWLLVSEGCHSCDKVLKKLTMFCKGKKPPVSQIGFFVTGRNEAKMLEKLKDYKEGYDIFSGSPSEFYTSYNLQASPSLLIKKTGKTALGETGIVKALTKDSKFCL